MFKYKNLEEFGHKVVEKSNDVIKSLYGLSNGLVHRFLYNKL